MYLNQLRIAFFFILLIFIPYQTAHAEMDKKAAQAIKRLSKRGYLFFANRRYGPVEKFILLGGEDIFKTNRKEFFISDYPKQAAKIIPQNVVKQIGQYMNKNYKILVKKKLKFYQLEDSNLKKLSSSYFYHYDIKNIEEENNK